MVILWMVPSSGMVNGMALRLATVVELPKIVVLPTVAAFATPVVRFSSKTREIKKDKFRVHNTLLFFFKSGDVERLTELTIFDLLTNVFRPLNAVFIACGP